MNDLDEFTEVPSSESLTSKYCSDAFDANMSRLIKNSVYITDWTELNDVENEVLYIKFKISENIDATSQVYSKLARELSESRINLTIVSQVDDGIIVDIQHEYSIFESYNEEN